MAESEEWERGVTASILNGNDGEACPVLVCFVLIWFGLASSFGMSYFVMKRNDFEKCGDML